MDIIPSKSIWFLIFRQQVVGVWIERDLFKFIQFLNLNSKDASLILFTLGEIEARESEVTCLRPPS